MQSIAPLKKLFLVTTADKTTDKQTDILFNTTLHVITQLLL